MSNQPIKLPIHETFQQTVQGEGYFAGCPVDFIRLSGCPVGCYFCDTGYADGGKGLPRTYRTIEELVSELKSLRVVISGGEPFINPFLPALVQAIIDSDRYVSIETSGSYWQNISDEAWVTVSPKEHVSPNYPVHPKMWGRANEFKFVISDGSELKHYQPLLPTKPNQSGEEAFIYLQPEWNERYRTVPLVIRLLEQNPSYRMSVQIHKFLGVQ